MENSYFVNEAIDYAIKAYMDSKTDPEGEIFNSFLVVIIRALVFIYGELDILNPYRTGNIKGLGGLDSNLKKYGLSDVALEDFKNKVLLYYQNQSSDELARPYFIAIERILVDMFAARCHHVLLNNDDVNNFKNFLYTKDNPSTYQKTLYDKYTPNSNMINEYLNYQVFRATHDYILTEYKDNTLQSEAYKIVGYDEATVIRMTPQQIAEVNDKVYNFFGIKSNDLNKKERLESAINYYKKYGKALTSGNGYVDMVLLASVIATILMIIIIVLIIVLR